MPQRSLSVRGLRGIVEVRKSRVKKMESKVPIGHGEEPPQKLEDELWCAASAEEVRQLLALPKKTGDGSE